MTAQSVIIPAPNGGWNTRDPLDGLGANEAIRLVNLFPEGQRLVLRRGYADHATEMGTDPIGGMYEHADPDGTKTIIACANDKIYNASTAGDATDITGTTAPTDNNWQGHQFNGKLLLLNGVDQPQQVDKTSVSDAAFTGIGDDAALVQGCGYKSRQYMVAVDSQSVWYGPINGVTGALIEFPVGAYLTRGGFIQWVTGYSRGVGQFSQDMLVIGSEKGEILTYAGNFPGDTWEIVGRYFTGDLLGRRSFVHIPGDLLLLTKNGITSLNSLMSGDSFGGVAAKINPQFATVAAERGDLVGFSATMHEAGKMLIVNVPQSTTISEQYVMNLQTGAWCKFTGWNARCFCSSAGRLYFGDVSGDVKRADYGRNDDGNYITIDCKWGFNYFDKPGLVKQFLDTALVIQCDSSATLGVAIDVDYRDSATPSDVSFTGSGGTAWGSAWGSPWSGIKQLFRKPAGLKGAGFCGALKMYGQLRGVAFEINAAQIRFNLGGEL